MGNGTNPKTSHNDLVVQNHAMAAWALCSEVSSL